jgi:hypothetical protein
MLLTTIALVVLDYYLTVLRSWRRKIRRDNRYLDCHSVAVCWTGVACVAVDCTFDVERDF